MIRVLCFCALAASSVIEAMAAPSLMMQRPSRVWRCEPHDPAVRQSATFYFFDRPFAVDRYGTGAELDRVDGIDLVVEVKGGDGETDEFTFGSHVLGYTEYRFAMLFSVRPSPGGPRLINFPQPAIETVIDRVSGELRLATAEMGSGNAACETVPDTFAATDAAYLRLLVRALADAGGQ